MPEVQSSDASDKVKPDEVVLKDVLKPSSLIIALTAIVLLILYCWYLFVLKPALNESNSMDVRLTYKPVSNTHVSQELKSNTRVETQITDDDLEPSNEAFKNEEKEVVKLINPSQRSKSTQRNTIRKSAKSNVATSEKESTVQSQDSPRHQNEYKEDKKEEKEDYIRAEEDREENKDEDTAQKIKSLAVKWKASFLTPATQPICTQVQIAMNQCPN